MEDVLLTTRELELFLKLPRPSWCPMILLAPWLKWANDGILYEVCDEQAPDHAFEKSLEKDAPFVLMGMFGESSFLNDLLSSIWLLCSTLETLRG